MVSAGFPMGNECSCRRPCRSRPKQKVSSPSLTASLQGHVDPELLEALDEEQKAMLFIQMRQEQLRKWRLREEAETRNPANQQPNSDKKKIRFLLLVLFTLQMADGTGRRGVGVGDGGSP